MPDTPLRLSLLASAVAFCIVAACSGDENTSSATPTEVWDQKRCEGEGGRLRCVDQGGTECNPDTVDLSSDPDATCECQCRIPTAGPDACEDLGGVPFCIGDKTGLICWQEAGDAECSCRCTVGTGVIGDPCQDIDGCLDVLECSSELGVCVRKCFDDHHCQSGTCIDSTYCALADGEPR